MPISYIHRPFPTTPYPGMTNYLSQPHLVQVLHAKGLQSTICVAHFQKPKPSKSRKTFSHCMSSQRPWTLTSPESYKPQAGQMAPKASRQVAFLLRITCKAEEQSQATGNQRAEASSNSKDCRLHSVASSLLQKNPQGKKRK